MEASRPVLVRDRISDLPLDVIEPILMCLPIRDAVRTTILSSKWKNKWKTIPELIFDDTCISSSSSDAEVCGEKFVNFVDNVLLLHQGPIRIFHLSSSYMEQCDELEEWMQFLSSRDLKEFSFIRKNYLDDWEVPSALFSYQYLTYLELVGFGFFEYLPVTSRCFSHLESLVFDSSYFTHQLQAFLDMCPRLQRFIFTSRSFSSIINIRAPNLKYLYVGGVFEDLCLEYTPLLSTINVDLDVDEEALQHIEETTTCNMIKVIGAAPLLESLVAQGYFVKYLSKNLQNNLHVKYDRLKELVLYAINFHYVDEISVAICLIANSPNLEKFTCLSCSIVKPCMEPDLDYWKTQHSLYSSFERLQSVIVANINGFPNELEFIRFLLLKKSVLKTMSIRPSSRAIAKDWDMLVAMLWELGYANGDTIKGISTDTGHTYAIRIGLTEWISDEDSSVRSGNLSDEENV